MPASYNVHPEFGFLCPTPRFHRRVRLVLAGFVAAGLGAGVLAATYSSRQEMTTNRVDAPSVAVTMPATVLAISLPCQFQCGRYKLCQRCKGPTGLGKDVQKNRAQMKRSMGARTSLS